MHLKPPMCAGGGCVHLRFDHKCIVSFEGLLAVCVLCVCGSVGACVRARECVYRFVCVSVWVWVRVCVMRIYNVYSCEEGSLQLPSCKQFC